ncbi:MAG: hypothetical protein HUK21_07180 [Fibrobacteraceae bacterium]|nr:hypothetical protein [Fibrobacteraceae bacterium]
MKYFAFFFVLLFSTATGAFSQTFVAILETMSHTEDVSLQEKLFVTDKIREVASNLFLGKGFIVMTRENISQMLPPDKSIEECEGNCLVETGKNIAADYIGQGRISRVGTKIALAVELYSTGDNNLVKSISLRAGDIDDLLNQLEARAPELFKPLIDGYQRKIAAAEMEAARQKAAKEFDEQESVQVPEPSVVESAESKPASVDPGVGKIDDANSAGEGGKSVVMKVLPWVVVAAGAALVGAGVYENSQIGNLRDDYKSVQGDQGQIDDAWDKVENARNLRNIFYGVGGGLLAVGVTLHFVF